MNCRICDNDVYVILDYGAMPLANNHELSLDITLKRYPLKLCWCKSCELLQHCTEVEPNDLFRHYQYFSSVSEDYARSRRILAEKLSALFVTRANFSVCEIACNDGYFLENFVGVADHVYGFEPAFEPSQVAKKKGINVIDDFFDLETARKFIDHRRLNFDLVLANNVLAHCPNVLSVLCGVEHILADAGVFICEFPSAEEFVDKCLFDTVYHEHFFYFSLHAFQKLATKAKLKVVSSSVYPEHGVSWRVALVKDKSSVDTVVRNEISGLFSSTLKVSDRKWFVDSFIDDIEIFRNMTNSVCYKIIEFLEKALAQGKVVGFIGASAKGNSLLNFLINHNDCAEKLINRCVGILDETPAKQGRFFSGTSLEILSKEIYLERRVEIHLILIWNHAEEVKRRYSSFLDGDLIAFMPNGMRVL